MTPSRAQQHERGVIWWFKVLGIVCGALIAASTLANWIGAFAWAQAAAPLRHEIAAQSDSLRAMVDREARARELGDFENAHRYAEIAGRLDEIHRLLKRRNP